MKTYSGIVEKVSEPRAARGSRYIRFKLNVASPEIFFAWEDGTVGYEVIERVKRGDAIEVDAEMIPGKNMARASVIRIADRELVCNKTLTQQIMEEAGQDTLF